MKWLPGLSASDRFMMAEQHVPHKLRGTMYTPIKFSHFAIKIFLENDCWDQTSRPCLSLLLISSDNLTFFLNFDSWVEDGVGQQIDRVIVCWFEAKFSVQFSLTRLDEYGFHSIDPESGAVKKHLPALKTSFVMPQEWFDIPNLILSYRCLYKSMKLSVSKSD